MLGSSCGSASKMACSSVCVMVRCSRPHSLTNMCSCWPMTRIESAAHDSLISLSNDDCCSARTNAAHKGARSSTGVARSGMAMAVAVDAAAAGGSREPAVGTGGGSVSRKMAATYACSASSTSTRHCSRVSVSAATLFVRSASPPTLYPTPRALLQQPQVSERTEPNRTERAKQRTYVEPRASCAVRALLSARKASSSASKMVSLPLPSLAVSSSDGCRTRTNERNAARTPARSCCERDWELPIERSTTQRHAREIAGYASERERARRTTSNKSKATIACAETFTLSVRIPSFIILPSSSSPSLAVAFALQHELCLVVPSSTRLYL